MALANVPPPTSAGERNVVKRRTAQILAFLRLVTGGLSPMGSCFPECSREIQISVSVTILCDKEPGLWASSGSMFGAEKSKRTC